MTTLDDMIKEIKTELEKDYLTLDEIRDNAGEWIDGYLPVYNNQIVQEWQAMPSEYDNRGYAELGQDGEIDIINLMSLDLYLYYSDLFALALDDVQNDLDEKEENN